MSDLVLWVDLDGTLVDYDAAVRQAIGEFVLAHDAWRHVDPVALADAWLASRRGLVLDGSKPLRSQRGARLAAVARKFEVWCDDGAAATWAQQIVDLAVARCRPYPDVDDFLERVGAVGVITNGERSFQQAKLAAAGLDLRRFDPFVASMDLGAAKPSPAIYLAAAEARGVGPARCVMIGDNPRADVAAALDAGYAAAVLLDRSPAPEARSVGSLTAALTALGSIGYRRRRT